LTKRDLIQQLLVTALERSEKLNEMEIEFEQLRQSGLRFREEPLVSWTKVIAVRKALNSVYS
jgi:hypothetical protein